MNKCMVNPTTPFLLFPKRKATEDNFLKKIIITYTKPKCGKSNFGKQETIDKITIKVLPVSLK